MKNTSCLILLTIFCIAYTVSYPSIYTSNIELNQLFNDTRDSLKALKVQEFVITADVTKKITKTLLKISDQIEKLEDVEKGIVHEVKSGVAVKNSYSVPPHIIINQRCHHNSILFEQCSKAKTFLSLCHQLCNYDMLYSTEYWYQDWDTTTTVEYELNTESDDGFPTYPAEDFKSIVEDFRLKFFKNERLRDENPYSGNCDCNAEPSYFNYLNDYWKFAVESGAILTL